jgi:CMP-N-acetylneuraminic acid synthetase
MASNGVIAFVFARGGSKGLPGKNLRLFAGKPLIAHAIEHALAVPCIDRVIVSTDSPDIASVARDYGAQVPFLRPAELAADDSPEWLSWRHALKFTQEETGVLPGVMVSVPATAPLRCPEDIERCLDLYSAGGADVIVTVSQAHRSPYFNMVQRRLDGTVALVVQTSREFGRRQDVPAVFDMTTIAYVADPEFVLSRDSIFQGRVKAVEIPPERAIDIDTRFDFEMAEFLMSRQIKPC